MILRITYSDGLVVDHHGDTETTILIADDAKVTKVELVSGTVQNPPWPNHTVITPTV
jgi:hypothetical protein